MKPIDRALNELLSKCKLPEKDDAYMKHAIKNDEWPTKKQLRELAVGEHVFYPLPSNYYPELSDDERLKKLRGVVKGRVVSARARRPKKKRHGQTFAGYAYHEDMMYRSHRVLIAQDYDGRKGVILFRHQDRKSSNVTKVARHKGYGQFEYKQVAAE